MQYEYDALMNNKTWKLVPYTCDMKLITCKWLFRVKYTNDGLVERYKARLVAQGFQQITWVDYFNTFNPVVKPLTLRILFILLSLKSGLFSKLILIMLFVMGS